MIAPLRSLSLARAWFALTAVLVLVALVIQVPVSAAVETGFFATPLYRGLNVFAFFTIQSNLLVAVSALLSALDPERDTLLRRVLRLTSLVAITVTGVVYHSVLAGLVGLSGWGYLADLLVHTATPVMAVLGWALFGPRGRTGWRVVLLSAGFPVLWLAFTLVRGPLVGGSGRTRSWTSTNWGGPGSCSTAPAWRSCSWASPRWPTLLTGCCRAAP